MVEESKREICEVRLLQTRLFCSVVRNTVSQELRTRFNSCLALIVVSVKWLTGVNASG